MESRLPRFDQEKYKGSCLIYSKGSYGIFLVMGLDDKAYVIKVVLGGYQGREDNETAIALYLLKFLKKNEFPNLMLPEGIYEGENPVYYTLFRGKDKKLNLPQCKELDVAKVFPNTRWNYNYYVTKACSYNLGYYFG